MTAPLLSILIPTVPERRETFLPRILGELQRQIGEKPVEVIGLYDNKYRSVGDKRNDLLALARGDFFTFIDDDDRIAPEYIDAVLDTIQKQPDADVIVYDTILTREGRKTQLCRYGIEFEYTNGPELWTGKPAHTMIWRRKPEVQGIKFIDKNFGEDTDWVKRACLRVQKQVRIEKVLYFYDFSYKTSETRDRITKKNISTPKDRPRYIPLPPGIDKVPRTVLRARAPVVVSVVMATFNHATLLDNTLNSIFRQRPPFDYEVIVVDDGSNDKTQRVCEVYRSFGNLLRYRRLNDNPGYRNPGIARNVGYKMAESPIIVAQSDDVVHETPDALEKLAIVKPGTFNVATVFNRGLGGPQYTGKQNPRPLFFLGALWRRDVYEIGGNCEEFTEAGYEDDWFGKCLIHGLGLKQNILEDVIGIHQDHARPNTTEAYSRMKALFERKFKAASEGREPWRGGEPWEYVEWEERFTEEKLVTA